MLKFRVTIKKPKILEFKQEPFLKLYIKHDTDLPREAGKEFNKIKKAKFLIKKQGSIW